MNNQQIGSDFELLKHFVENILEGQNGRIREQDLDLATKWRVSPTYIQKLCIHTYSLLKKMHKKKQLEWSAVLQEHIES